mmetsp:Transcript_36606/g.60248  ORF Transcript_36606/g.60248 Transcript_36606/m.60248 type:complete len:209 (-) Transcript_36606:481-1107(-)
MLPMTIGASRTATKQSKLPAHWILLIHRYCFSRRSRHSSRRRRRRSCSCTRSRSRRRFFHSRMFPLTRFTTLAPSFLHKIPTPIRLKTFLHRCSSSSAFLDLLIRIHCRRRRRHYFMFQFLLKLALLILNIEHILTQPIQRAFTFLFLRKQLLRALLIAVAFAHNLIRLRLISSTYRAHILVQRVQLSLHRRHFFLFTRQLLFELIQL